MGFADVIVGAESCGNGENFEGRTFVYHGSAAGLQTSPAWTAVGNQAGAAFGISVATAGDVNGDGFADVIIGAYFYSNGELWNYGVLAIGYNSGTPRCATTATRADVQELRSLGTSTPWELAAVGLALGSRRGGATRRQARIGGR